MYLGRTVGVVVPAYNEEGFVGDVIETMPEFVDRIYAVDDCSTDGTWAEITRYARGDGGETALAADGGAATRVVPIRHDVNRGAGGAIKTGYIRARDDGMDVTVTVDADGQMDPDLMARLLNPVVLGYADYAKGNRLANTKYRAAMPRFRLFGNWTLTFLTRIASGYWRLMDPQNGYTAISNGALHAVDLEGMYEYYGYCNDLLVKLNAAGVRVADVAMPAAYGDEESSIEYGEYVRNVSLMLLRNFLWRLRVRYLGRTVGAPAAFYALAAAGLAVGLLSALGLLSSLRGTPASATLSSVGAFPLLAGGGVSLLAAMAADRRASRDLEVTLE